MSVSIDCYIIINLMKGNQVNSCFELPYAITNPMRTKAQQTKAIGLSYGALLYEF